MKILFKFLDFNRVWQTDIICQFTLPVNWRVGRKCLLGLLSVEMLPTKFAILVNIMCEH